MKKKSAGTGTNLKLVGQNLYRHSESGIYWAKRKVNGVRVARSLLTTNPKTAAESLATWLAENSTDRAPQADATLETLLVAFERARAGCSESTRITEGGYFKKVRARFPVPLTARVRTVEASDIAVFHAAETKGWRHESSNRLRLFLKQLFAAAVSDRMIAKTPFEPKLVRWLKPERVVRNVPMRDEFEAIVAEIRQPTNRSGKASGFRTTPNDESADFAEFLGLAGVGEAEASTLLWADVKWDFNNGQGQIGYVRMKTGKEFYTPLYPWLRPLLKRLYDARTDGRVFHILSIRKTLERSCVRLRYPKFSPRNLRAVLIGRLWKAGTDLKLIAEWQGHQDGGVLILKIYTNVFGSRDAEYRAAQVAKAV